MSECNSVHEVLVVVGQVRPVPGADVPVLHVLLWQHSLGPEAGRWALPGGEVRHDEDLPASATRQLAEKVDVRSLSHLESVSEFSDPARIPGRRVFASGFLGVLPSDADPDLPDDTAWFRVDALPDTVYDHADIVARARDRLAAKLSYSTLGFALAPDEFTLSWLAQLYGAALGHQVDPTNLQRILTRRGELVRCGRSAPPGPSGGRPAALYRFAERRLRITDQFATLRPPNSDPLRLPPRPSPASR
ncbi:NUDIX hydrolase [Dietzia alimentaria]|uniref:NUDIX hydrolase n=1 Tax=Dietzia alimentaria TaxID=665550 RepID=UPI000527FFFB|nr:NUDIX domain-containing protein [Dietzia alimentaria]